MKTYKANFNTNGTSFLIPIEGNNKSQLIKDIREIANGNRFAGNECTWEVWIEEGNNIKYIAKGGTYANGVKWIAKGDKLR